MSQVNQHISQLREDFMKGELSENNLNKTPDLQFEQWMNAAYIDKLGYGKHCKSLNATDLKEFLEGIAVYEKNLAKYNQDGNRVLFEALDGYMEAI